MLISYHLLDEIVNGDNIFIGYFNLYLQFIKNNMWCTSRKRAHILPYPHFSQIDEIKRLRLLINTNGISENSQGSYKNLLLGIMNEY
ncbi:MAG: hypothetical protein ACI9YH_000489 [Colwellia sp.]